MLIPWSNRRFSQSSLENIWENHEWNKFALIYDKRMKTHIFEGATRIILTDFKLPQWKMTKILSQKKKLRFWVKKNGSDPNTLFQKN